MPENFTINRANKTFVFDDGEELPIPKDKVKEVLRTATGKKSKENAYKESKMLTEGGGPLTSFHHNFDSSFLGDMGKTAGDYIESGVNAFTTGEGQEELGYVDRVLDHFYAKQEGRKQSLDELSAENPKSAMAGNVGGMIGELITTGKLPAAAALPLMGAAHSETSFLEPAEKLPEVAQDAVLGYGADKIFKGLSTVAGHRQTRRGVQDAIRSTEAQNLAEGERALIANSTEASRFATESAARDAEIARLPGLQQAENQAFIDGSAQKVERVGQTLGKTPISKQAMGVESYINDVIETSASAGTKEAKRASAVLEGAFKGNAEGKLTADSIQRGMRTVDEVIAKEGGEVGRILSEYRGHVASELPKKLGNYYAFEKWVPKIENRLSTFIKNDFNAAFKHSPQVGEELASTLGRKFEGNLNKSIQADIKAVFESHAGDIEGGLANGTISKDINAAIEANPLYQEAIDTILEFRTGKVGKGSNIPFGMVKPTNPVPKGYQKVVDDLMNYPANISERFGTISERYLPDIRLDSLTKSSIADKSLSQLPKAPNILPQPAAVRPAQTAQPNMLPVPQIPEPQGVGQRLAYGLEQAGELGAGQIGSQLKRNAPAGILAKMAGIPVGKMAVGAAGLVTGLSALTSPSAFGRASRTFLEQSVRMLDAVNQRASQYPSHTGNGVLDNPMERRSLVREVEDDLNMRIEDKALIQSKINRGKPLLPPQKTNRKQDDTSKF